MISRSKLVVLLVLLSALPFAASPSAHAEDKARAGTRISATGPAAQTFPAGQPFHFAHGWSIDHTTPPPTVGLWRFSLSVDGVETREDYVDKFFTEDATFGTLQNRFWVFNFPDGMTGTHTFSARWSGPCQPAVDSGLIAGPCEHPNDIVTLLARVVSVSFVAEEVSLATVR